MDSKCHPEGQCGFQQQVPCVGLISGDIFLNDGWVYKIYIFFYSFLLKRYMFHVLMSSQFTFLIRYFWEGLGVVGSKEGLVAKDSTI